MKTILLSFCSLSLALSCLVQLNAIPLPGAKEGKQSAPRITKSGGIERDYRAGKLTEAQEKIVLALAKNTFGKKIRQHGFDSEKRGHKNVLTWIGLGVKPMEQLL